MSKLPSASAVGSAMICGARFVLPHATTTDESVYATKGHTVHEGIKQIVNAPNREAARDEVLATVAPDDPGYTILACLDVDELPCGGIEELALAYSPESDTVREVGRDIARAYEAHGVDREQEIAGSVDLVGVVDGVAVVIDWKTGVKAGPARKSWQMRTLALMAARYFGVERARAIHYHIDDAGEIRKGVPLELGEFDLAAVAGALAEMKRRHVALDEAHRSGRRLPVVQGSHCNAGGSMECPALRYCPAWTGLLRVALDESEVAEATAPIPTEIDDAALGAKVKLAMALRDALDRFLDDATVYARTRPRGLPIIGESGREEAYFMEMPGSFRDKIADAGKARAYLEEHYGPDVAKAAVQVEPHTTKALLKSALAPWCRAHGRKLKDEEPKLYAALRDCGAIERTESDARVQLVGSEEAARVLETLPAPQRAA